MDLVGLNDDKGNAGGGDGELHVQALDLRFAYTSAHIITKIKFTSALMNNYVTHAI